MHTCICCRNQRDRYVVATKVRSNMDPSNPNQVGLGRRHITQAIEDSLQRLQTNYVDIYQVIRLVTSVR